jgi:glyoxylase-like metal-dependent hydrolase (beta-lactamase superfamily II)
VVAVTFRGRQRAMWTLDSAALHDDDGTVILTTGDIVLAVDAPKPWPPWAAQRTADQLVAGLRDARRQALDGPHTPAPPDLAVPSRPLLLYAVWALTVLGVAALFGW